MGEKNNQAKALKIELWVGRMPVRGKTTAADSKPPEKGEDTAGRGSHTPSAAACGETGQG